MTLTHILSFQKEKTSHLAWPRVSLRYQSSALCNGRPDRLPDPAGSSSRRGEDPGRGSLWNFVVDLSTWRRMCARVQQFPDSICCKGFSMQQI